MIIDKILMIDKTFLNFLIIILGVSYVIFLAFPFSISFFYKKVFKRRVYPFLFIVSAALFSISLFIFSYDFFSLIGSGFFAAAGIVLAAASIRLYIVMTGGH